MRLKDRVAIVTGSSRGIGLAIARGFAQEGAQVVLTGRNESSLVGPTEELSGLGVRVLPLRLDVSSPRDVEEMVNRVDNEFGRSVPSVDFSSSQFDHEANPRSWACTGRPRRRGGRRSDPSPPGRRWYGPPSPRRDYLLAATMRVTSDTNSFASATLLSASSLVMSLVTL